MLRHCGVNRHRNGYVLKADLAKPKLGENLGAGRNIVSGSDDQVRRDRKRFDCVSGMALLRNSRLRRDGPIPR